MRFFVIPLSFIYYLIVSLRDFFYNSYILKRHTLAAKVVSVGNITWGGTGKTPMVLFILEALLREKRKPAILIRGYGNDEQDLLSKYVQGVPVILGGDRVKSGREAIVKHSADTLLLDDGFQYRRLKRDLDIVCIDAINPFGNGWMIPAGSMREGFSSLKRADIFLITKVDLVQSRKILADLESRLRKINPDALIVKSIHKVQHFYRLSNNEIVERGELKDKGLVLVSAIGSPDSFERTILNHGLRFRKHFIFRDHHWYTEKDLREIQDWCITHNIDTVITTEKDAVKLKATSYQLPATSFLILTIKLKITENEKGFYNRLFGIYSN